MLTIANSKDDNRIYCIPVESDQKVPLPRTDIPQVISFRCIENTSMEQVDLRKRNWFESDVGIVCLQLTQRQ